MSKYTLLVFAFLSFFITNAYSATIEYTGGDYNPADGDSLYLTGNVTVNDNENIIVADGITAKLSMEGFKIINANPPTADWDWIIVNSGGDFTVTNGDTIDTDIGITNNGTLRMQGVVMLGATSGNFYKTLQLGSGSWSRFDECSFDSYGSERMGIINGGSTYLYNCFANSHNQKTFDVNDGGFYAYNSTLVNERATTAGNVLDLAGCDTLIVQNSILTVEGGGYIATALYTPIVWQTTYNVWHNFGGSLISYKTDTADTTPDDNNGLYEDPKFTDTASGDYTCTGAGPGINTGTGTRTTDFFGNTGVYGGVIDRGFAELQSAKCPTAAFTGTPTTGFASLEVTFTDASTESPSAWAWDFGDGSGTSSSQNPTYTYTSPGTLDVTLIVTNSCGNDTLVKSAYIQARDGSTNGVCCVDAGLSTQGTCTVATEAECSAIDGGHFFSDETVCSPNPCPTAGDLVSGLAMRPEHPRFFPSGHLDRLKDAYDANTVNSEIKSAWDYIVLKTTTDWMLNGRDNQSHYNIGSMALTWALTRDQEVADSLIATLNYLASANDLETLEYDNVAFATDIMWDQLSTSERSALLATYDDILVKSDGSGISTDRRSSGAYNLMANEAYIPFAWAVVLYGTDLSTEHDYLANVLDDGYSRFMGGLSLDDDNSIKDWYRSFWPDWLSYQKGPGYGAKYMSEGVLAFAYLCSISELSQAPKDSFQTSWENGNSSLYQYRFRDGNNTWSYLLGWVGIQSYSLRDIKIAGMELQLDSNPISTYALVEGGEWDQRQSAFSWASGLMFMPPDSLVEDATITTQPLFSFAGSEGDTLPTVGSPGWSDFALGRFGATPWPTETQNNGMFTFQAMYAQADAWNENVPLAFQIFDNGTISKRCGPYDNDEGGLYPDYTSSGWNVPTLCILNNDSGTYTENWEMVGPLQMYNHSDAAGPIDDWFGEQNKYEKGNIVAAGMDSSLGAVYAAFLSGKIESHAYGDTASIGLRRQTRDIIAVVPDRQAGRALFFGYDRVTIDPNAWSSGETVFANWPIVGNVTVNGGTTDATWDIPTYTADVVDYSGINYVQVDNDTTNSAESFTAHGRFYPISGDSLLRVMYGRGLEWGTYSDFSDPVTTWEAQEPDSATLANRRIYNENGMGKLELHASTPTNTNLVWLWETHNDDAEPSFSWASPTSITSSDMVGVVVDSVCVVLPKDPNSGGPWSLTYTGTKDVIIAGLPDGWYYLSETDSALSADSLMIFEDLAGSTFSLTTTLSDLGACCGDGNGLCKVTTEEDCTSLGGTFQGTGTDCDPLPCATSWHTLDYGPKLALIGPRPYGYFNDRNTTYSEGEAEAVAANYDLVQTKTRGEITPLRALNDSIINLFDCTFVAGVDIGYDYLSEDAMPDWLIPDTTWSARRLIQYAYWRNLYEDGTDFALKDINDNYIEVYGFRACNWTDECPTGTWGWTAGLKWSEVCYEALVRTMERNEFMDNWNGLHFDTLPPFCCYLTQFLNVDYDDDGLPDGCTGSCTQSGNAWLTAQRAEVSEFSTNLLAYTRPRHIPVLHTNRTVSNTQAEYFSGWKIESWLYQSGAPSNEWLDWWSDPNEYGNLYAYKEAEETLIADADSLGGWDWVLLEPLMQSGWTTDRKNQHARYGLGTAALGDGYFGIGVQGSFYYTDSYTIPEMDKATGWRWQLPALTDAYAYTEGGVDQWRRKFFRPNGDSCMVVVSIDNEDAYLYGHGACCIDQSCSLLFEIDCIEGGGTYLGDDVSCSPEPCDYGVCCNNDLECSITLESDCFIDYYWDGDQEECLPGLCVEASIAACCLETGECVTTDKLTCESLAGGWSSFTASCDALSCVTGDGPPGACCIIDGNECRYLTETACEALEDDGMTNTWEGPGVFCSPDPCPILGSCCLPTGGCLIRTQVTCENNANGVWTQGVDCDPDPCEASGACCFADGSCEVGYVTLSCESDGGIFEGEGTVCDPNPCSLGACCYDNGTCILEFEDDCDGVWDGGDVCVPNPCQPPADDILNTIPQHKNVKTKVKIGFIADTHFQTYDGSTNWLTTSKYLGSDFTWRDVIGKICDYYVTNGYDAVVDMGDISMNQRVPEVSDSVVIFFADSLTNRGVTFLPGIGNHETKHPATLPEQPDTVMFPSWPDDETDEPYTYIEGKYPQLFRGKSYYNYEIGSVKLIIANNIVDTTTYSASQWHQRFANSNVPGKGNHYWNSENSIGDDGWTADSVDQGIGRQDFTNEDYGGFQTYGSEQWNWFVNQLSDTRYTWRIPLMHRGIYAYGDVTNRPNAYGQRYGLIAEATERNVPLLVTGDVHVMNLTKRIHTEENGTSFLADTLDASDAYADSSYGQWGLDNGDLMGTHFLSIRTGLSRALGEIEGKTFPWDGGAAAANLFYSDITDSTGVGSFSWFACLDINGKRGLLDIRRVTISPGGDLTTVSGYKTVLEVQ